MGFVFSTQQGEEVENDPHGLTFPQREKEGGGERESFH